MRTQDSHIIQLVDRIRKSLLRRKFAFIALSGLSIAALLIVSFSLFVPQLGWREDQLFTLFTLLLLIPLIGLCLAVFKCFKATISRQEVALRVENARPELMDAYACAVDIAEQGGPGSPIEEALTRQLKDKFQSGEIGRIVIPAYLQKPILAMLIAATVLLTYLAFGSPLAQTALFHAKARANPVFAGVQVRPGNVSLPQGKDLRVEATIKRGRQEAQLEYTLGDKWVSLDMFDEGEGLLAAVIYGVDNDFQYRVVTPDVTSEKYTVEVYLEPKVKDIKITATPPAYMERSPISVTEFKDLVVPENSVVVLELTANKPSKAILVEDETEIPLSSTFALDHKYSFKAQETHNYSITLNDDQARTSKSEPFKISVVKDMPPHVEVTEPGKDVSKYSHDIVQLEVNALDDFGLESIDLHLVFSTDVDGKFVYDSRVIKLFKKDLDRVLEKTIFYDLNLKDEAAKEGDIITYHFTAEDNKQPIPQSSRSKIFFIEIRPDESDVQQNEQEGEGEEKQISVNDLIALQKDLIRKLIDVKAASLENAAEGKFIVEDGDRQSLSAATAALKLQVQKRYDDLKAEADKMQADLGVIGDYFLGSIESLTGAELALNEDKLDEGMKMHNKSLHNLIKISIELDKNTQRSKSNKPSESQESPPQQQKEDQERLADTLEKLEELQEKQKDLNKKMRDEKNNEELAQQQLQQDMQEQQQKMQEMAEQLQDMQQQQAAAQMQQAAGQQQAAQQQQQQGNSQGAQQSSQQAEKSIENASGEIKRAMRDKARQKLQQLSKKLDKTIEKQQDINQQTSAVEDPKSEPGKQALTNLKKQQDEVQKEVQELMDQLGAAANELDDKYPEVAEALRESREFASNNGMQRKLKRSSNALHYKRQEAAEREQQQAVETMNLLGHKVRDAMGRLPQATLDELLAMRQQLEVLRRQVAGSQGQSSEQASRMSGQISAILQDMGERLKSDDLQNKLPQFLEATSQAGDVGTISTNQLKAVNQAAFILETMINRADLEKRLTLNRRTGAAPDKYRRSVREYLRSLSIQER